MNYIITAVIAIVTVAGGFFVQDKVAPSVGASQSISSLTELTSLSHNDVLPITDTANATTKKVKWGTATSSMKAVFDPLYSPIFSTSAGLAGLLSDETGSGGAAVFATSPTISGATLNGVTINTSFAGSAVLGIDQGGTGSTTKVSALNALLPTQTTADTVLTSDGTNVSWGANPNPAGVVLAYASTTAPTGYLLCDGTAVSRATYAGLFAVIGVTYGVGDNSTTFNLPDLRGRNVIMASSTLSLTIASSGGEKTHTQTIAEMPAHTHEGTFYNVNNNANTGPAYAGGVSGTRAVPSEGGGTAFNVMDPYLVMNYIIKI